MTNIGSAPHDLNHVPGLIVQSNTGARSDPMVELYADPTTHRLLVDSGSSGGGGTEYTDGDAPPTHPIAPALLWNNGGTWEVVSAANPLPVTGSFSGGATSANQTNGTQQTMITDGTNVAAVKNGSFGNVLSVEQPSASGTALADGSSNDPARFVDEGFNRIYNPSYPFLFNGTTWDRARGDSTNGAFVNIKSSVSLAVTGTFWQATQPISAVSLPLPSGAATAAKQPALGTAGSASSDVLTIQGITSMIPIKVDGSAVTQPVSGTFWQATQPVSLSSVPSHAVTNAGTFAVQASINSSQTIGLVAGSAIIGKVGIDQTTPGTTNAVQIAKKDTFGTATAFTITLASLASSTSGVGRQATLITSNTAQSALIAVKFTVGTTPTANTLINIYLIRGDGTIKDDNAGATDAAITIINAPLLGQLLCSATTTNATYYSLFDTKFLGSLGPTFGIAIVNATGVTANATAGNFTAEYTLIT